MNAKAIYIATWFSCISNAWAIDFPYVIEDPLLTRPNVLNQGTVYPNDTNAIACSQRFDFDTSYSAHHPFTLPVAVDMALCHNPQVKSAWAAIKVQAAAKGEARAAYVPSLNATVSNLRNSTQYTDGSFPDVDNKGHTKYASLTWRLLDFGSRSANLESSNQLLKVAIASHDVAIQKVLLNVIGAYFDLMTAQAVYNAKKQAVDLAISTSKATQRREEKGVAAVSDSLQARSSLAKAELSLSRALGDMNKASSVLSYAIGLPNETALVLPDEIASTHAERVSDLSRWMLDAQATHPSIVEARAQFASAQAKVKVAKAEGLPTLDFSQNHYQNGYPNQGLSATQSRVNTIGLTLTVPLFEGFARTYKVRGAQAQAEQSYAQFLDAELQVSMDVVKAYADAQSSFENLNSSNTWLQAAQAAVHSAQKRYDKGAADILELLSTQNTLADAQQERVRCVSEWRSSRLRLMASAGMLDRYQIMNAN
jgi:outer membrane protein